MIDLSKFGYIQPTFIHYLISKRVTDDGKNVIFSKCLNMPMTFDMILRENVKRYKEVSLLP